MRQQFPKDSRIQLTEIGGNPRPISPGSTGKLDYIDDAGQFHVKWDNGCTLALVLGEDRFSVYLPEPQTFKLYMPLTADFYGRDEWGDMSEDGEEWDGRTLMDYEGQILSALVKNRVPEENESGLMHWYGEDDSVDHKVRSAVFTVEVRNRQLWGVAECRVAGELTPEELTILKEYLGGQASDGWGEGFEQRPIEVDGGELYVHLWQPDDWSIQTEQERFAPKVAEGLPELCFSTLRTTGQLICIKRGETGYYPSDWDTGDKEGNVELADELNEDLGVTPIQRQATQGKSYRGNIEGSDPRCSFHWVGTSDRLYVFEAPIDLLAFLTLYPDGWQQHSYVALCGTAEHAMLWMLEKNPNLRKAILCLDHDAAGIEAAGRLSDILREHGYSQIASLQSEHKDWDEDLKAWNGLEAQPAEEHPQFAVAGLVCRRIGARCKEVQPDRAVYQFPGLLLRYRNDLHWGRFDQAMERMETMAALALSVVLRECKQMGTALTTEQGVRFLESHILPHQNRGILKNRADEIAMQFQSVLAKNNCQGIRTQAEKKEVASAWLELAISCAKVPVKYEADEIKRRQKEEKTQREAEPVMA